MPPRSLFLVLLLPRLITLSHSQVLSQLQLYTDAHCANASPLHADVSVDVEICLVTTGLGSISHSSVPCTSGNVQLLAFSDTVCGQQLGVMDWYRSETCFARFTGDIAAVLLTCNQQTDAGTFDEGTVTATSTVVVAAVAGATEAASSPTGKGAGAVTTGTLSSSAASVGSTTLTPSSSSSASTSNSTSTPPSSSTSSSSSSSSSSSKLSTSDIIALGVGIGVGLPTIILGLLGWLYPREKKKKLERRQAWEVQQQMQQPGYQQGHHLMY